MEMSMLEGAAKMQGGEGTITFPSRRLTFHYLQLMNRSGRSASRPVDILLFTDLSTTVNYRQWLFNYYRIILLILISFYFHDIPAILFSSARGYVLLKGNVGSE